MQPCRPGARARHPRWPRLRFPAGVVAVLATIVATTAFVGAAPESQQAHAAHRAQPVGQELEASAAVQQWAARAARQASDTRTVRAATPEQDDVTHHEFQVNCSVTRRLSDDPIVFPGQPGASHNHTFLGNTTTDAHSTTESLLAAGSGATSCLAPDDLSAYWFPTMFNGDQVVTPTGRQVVYYKSGILDYTDVVPFPQGLRFVVGDMMATEEEFRDAPGAVEGWECGDSFFNWDFPEVTCPAGSQLNVRYQAPSCWDGVHLDSADHQSHMAYPRDGVCPASHPVAVPMLEFKIAFPVDGDVSDVELASGRGFSWHYDFFNAWDPPTLKALVEHCVNGGLQCDARGFDQYKPDRGAALGEDYRLP